MERIEIKLPAAVAEGLKAAADARGISRTAMANVVLYDFVRNSGWMAPAAATLPPIEVHPEQGPQNTADPVEVQEPMDKALASDETDPLLRATPYAGPDGVEIWVSDRLARDMGFRGRHEVLNAVEGVAYDPKMDVVHMTLDGALELATVFDLEGRDLMANELRTLVEKFRRLTPD